MTLMCDSLTDWHDHHTQKYLNSNGFNIFSKHDDEEFKASHGLLCVPEEEEEEEGCEA